MSGSVSRQRRLPGCHVDDDDDDDDNNNDCLSLCQFLQFFQLFLVSCNRLLEHVGFSSMFRLTITHINRLSITHQLAVNHTSTGCQSHINGLSITDQLAVNCTNYLYMGVCMGVCMCTPDPPAEGGVFTRSTSRGGCVHQIHQRRGCVHQIHQRRGCAHQVHQRRGRVLTSCSSICSFSSWISSL